MTEYSIRNPDFAAKLALTYAELYDGVAPHRQRVSLRIHSNALELINVETRKEQRWLLDRIRQVPDQSDSAAMMFAPDNESPARLVIREVEALRTLLNSNAPLEPVSGPRNGLKRVGIMSVIAAACFGGLLFGLVPWFANTAAERIPPQAEIAMGQEIFNVIYTSDGSPTCNAPDGVAALRAMEARLTEGTDVYIPLSVQVVQNPTVNATALSGGYVTLHSALILAAETPEEVAAVLAHEIGHVAHRDVTRAQLRAMGSYGLVGLLFGDVFGVTLAAGVSSAVLDSAYSRAAEERADDYAHAMMAESGLPPEALGTFFQRLQHQHGDIEMGILEHVSTHPAMLDRIAASLEAGTVPRAEGAPVLTDAQWQALRNICNISGAAPAEGAAPAGEVVGNAGKG